MQSMDYAVCRTLIKYNCLAGSRYFGSTTLNLACGISYLFGEDEGEHWHNNPNFV